MQKDQLLKFKEHLAECHTDPFIKSEIIRHTCNVARENYKIEFGEGDAVGKLIREHDIMVGYVNSTPSPPVTDEAAKIIKRLHDIDVMLYRVLNGKFIMLRVTPPPSSPQK